MQTASVLIVISTSAASEPNATQIYTMPQPVFAHARKLFQTPFQTDGCTACASAGTSGLLDMSVMESFFRNAVRIQRFKIKQVLVRSDEFDLHSAQAPGEAAMAPKLLAGHLPVAKQPPREVDAIKSGTPARAWRYQPVRVSTSAVSHIAGAGA